MRAKRIHSQAANIWKAGRGCFPSRVFRRPPSHGETADLSEVRSQHTTERSWHHLLDLNLPRIWIFLVLTRSLTPLLEDQSSDSNPDFNLETASHAGFFPNPTSDLISRRLSVFRTILYFDQIRVPACLHICPFYICQGKMSPRNWYDWQHASKMLCITVHGMKLI